MSAQSKQTAHKHSHILGKIKITHPYHPLNGKVFEVLKIRELNGSRHYSIYTDTDNICIPESWTDRMVKNTNTKIHFEAETLRELSQFFQNLNKYNTID